MKELRRTKLSGLLLITNIFCVAACADADESLLDANRKVAYPAEQQVETVVKDEATTLSKAEAETYGTQLVAEWKDRLLEDMAESFNKKQLTIGDKTMKLAWSIYGDKPQDGYALYISLHGGGGTTASENNGQWRNQQKLYQPDQAVYVSPRAIDNTWDMHFLPETDEFYHQIIMMTTAYLDVNPDKVYIMGYSAGGDGVWRLAPRMADYWAAASMMAGHPGDVSLVNLRNTPFSIWCGAEDSDYDRNLRCTERIQEMQSLHAADPDGYIYDGHIMEGKGHWMDGEDAVAVDWMAQYKRNPYPKRVVWQQEEVLHTDFYWLSAPASELERGKKVIADISGNTIDFTQCDYSMLTLSLNDKMLDLDKPVKVTLHGKTLFEGTVERKLSTLRATLYGRNDPSYMFPAQILVRFE